MNNYRLHRIAQTQATPNQLPHELTKALGSAATANNLGKLDLTEDSLDQILCQKGRIAISHFNPRVTENPIPTHILPNYLYNLDPSTKQKQKKENSND